MQSKSTRRVINYCFDPNDATYVAWDVVTGEELATARTAHELKVGDEDKEIWRLTSPIPVGFNRKAGENTWKL